LTWLFGVALLVGMVASIAWIALVASAASVEGATRWDPEARFGPTGRSIVAGVLGFGMAGISALYAGWADAVAVVAGVVGGVALVGVSRWLGPRGTN